MIAKPYRRRTQTLVDFDREIKRENSLLREFERLAAESPDGKVRKQDHPWLVDQLTAKGLLKMAPEATSR